MLDDIPVEVTKGLKIRADQQKRKVFIECATERLLEIAEKYRPEFQTAFRDEEGYFQISLFTLYPLVQLRCSHGEKFSLPSEDLDKIWQSTLEKFSAFLRPLFSHNCKLKSFCGQHATVEVVVPPMHKVIVSRRAELFAALRETCGHPITLSFESSPQKKRPVCNRPALPDSEFDYTAMPF